jgi:hypothetical protein
MQMRTARTVVFLLVLPTASVCQTKISGIAKCGQSEQRQRIDIGDRINHAYMIGQVKCIWTKPFGIAGSNSKEYLITGFTELSGDTARGHSFIVGTLENGDRFQLHSQGMDTLKNGVFQGGKGSWRFVGGTGNLKGIQGQGTYTIRAGTDGATYEMQGQYELPK